MPFGQTAALSRMVSRLVGLGDGFGVSNVRGTQSPPVPADPQAYWNFWHAVHVKLLSLTNWRLDAPCSLSAVAELCWQAPGGGPCQSLVPPLSPKNINDSVSQVGRLEEEGRARDHLWESITSPLSIEGV